VAVGVWEPTGARSAELTISAQRDTGDPRTGNLTLRATVDIDSDAGSWTGSAIVEHLGPDGVASEQVVPIPAAATRIVVEPMTPAASPGA